MLPGNSGRINAIIYRQADGYVITDLIRLVADDLAICRWQISG